MEIDHLLSTTRAVRRKLDLDRPVEPEVLEECLDLALQAPTPGNVQAWRWLVVRDQDVKDRLSVLFRAVGEAYLAERASAAPSRMLASGRHLLEVIDRVPVFVIPVLAGRPAGDNAVDAAFYGGIFPAVWNFQLALRSRGLGSTLTTYHLAREAEAAAILGIPEGHTQAGLLPVAYTTVPDFKPAARSPLAEVAYLDHWGTPLS
ncbi:nitroreductase family protein [Amycolatopsis tolypomycina]|nr:nitroreductase family protein [Amycolatopsis tolypomycina]